MNILAVGAHYDDVEIGCSGTLINHVAKGDKVHVLVTTDSAYRNPKGEVIRAAEVAEREGREAARLMGVELVCLNYKTFFVPFDEDLTRALDYYLKKFEIDTVYCHWHEDIHRDHQFTSKATIMASRHVRRVLMYRSNYYDSVSTFNANVYSDISESMDRKIEAIKMHKSELERVQNSWIEFIQHQNALDGQKIGVKYAETFQIVRYLL